MPCPDCISAAISADKRLWTGTAHATAAADIGTLLIISSVRDIVITSSFRIAAQDNEKNFLCNIVRICIIYFSPPVCYH
jgi:hypothetical protein